MSHGTVSVPHEFLSLARARTEVVEHLELLGLQLVRVQEDAGGLLELLVLQKHQTEGGVGAEVVRVRGKDAAEGGERLLLAVGLQQGERVVEQKVRVRRLLRAQRHGALLGTQLGQRDPFHPRHVSRLERIDRTS